MYLGHEYKKSIGTLASRLTLHTNREIQLYFFSSTSSDLKEDGLEYGLQGFCISHHSLKEIPLDIIEEAIKDLDGIYINKHHLPHEILLTIAADDKVMNHWYKTMWEGAVANKICKHFDYFEKSYDDDVISAYSKKIRKELSNQLITI